MKAIFASYGRTLLATSLTAVNVGVAVRVGVFVAVNVGVAVRVGVGVAVGHIVSVPLCTEYVPGPTPS